MAILLAEYAQCGRSHSASARGAGATVRTRGAGERRRCGAHARDTRCAPLRLTRIMAS